MKINRTMVAMVGSAAMLVTLAGAPRAEVKIGWKGSTKIEDKDAGYSIKFGGRIMNDWSFIKADDDLDAAFSDQFTDGTEFRRVRFYSSGTIYHVVYYKAQYDYASGLSEFKDVYVGVKNIPLLGSVQVGHMYEPFGLEEMTSSKVITFMERAATSNMTPSRKTGAMFKRELDNKRGTFAAGVFRNSDDVGRAEGHKYNVTARVTAVPVMKDDGRRLVHLGAAASVRKPEGDSYRLRARPSTHIAPRLVNTGHLEMTDQVVQFGGEAAAVFGPASVQGEYIYAQASNDTLNDPAFNSFYVQASYVLTGEHRGYKGGLMEGVHPDKNFDGTGGIGAWELAVRFSRIDLDDQTVAGGTLGDVTAGLNWYLNPYTRVMFNYVHADLKDVGKCDSFMTRFQVAF